ncbi:hypothetical protein GCM10025859_67480 [Alicyclobacillus fastidiosus]|nr:hypothetical protein GCM10025859_67480 [Alicyclobacillus fastidiosus]
MGANAHFLKDRTIEESAKTECREAIAHTGAIVQEWNRLVTTEILYTNFDRLVTTEN